ncbi:5-(carboxyamino)imidazole ribonucleotide synthase [Dactylosporangium sp. AC04546]|uniref:5-(carboxyamino)imidazole ribonucleotide synthase n=1 Tax=Dactylosporangium sp. AC04546 TaxID=2862460 RepID=UPI001EDF36A3|nr:5-(carboxyamino)imidazole ribonucleotide synthase [Dactylosporangium sp. AC04546]WVK83025.1 5-(carboxyamino)imidazole ribonucleotide synthase [Dactylosporangium sp. AC04546]
MDARTGLPVVGMVGGGQLARMTHQAAIALGQSLRVLAVAPDDGAALVAPDVVIGRHDDVDAVREFAKGCDVVTFDHEHVPGEVIRTLAAEGFTLLPGADALRYAQNKREMREHLGALGLPVPRWTADDLGAFGDEVGWPIIVKTASGGYDGRGVFVARSVADVPPGVEVIGEELVPIARELAAVVARSPLGQVAAYPVVETVQQDGICVEVLAPAPGLDDDSAIEAQRLAIDIATRLGVVGVLAVELFETTDGRILINELAMRPHNSAHWTIEGARTSQFEQHLRAVLDYPMGDTGLTAPAVVMVNVLGGEPGGMSIDERLHHLFAEEPSAKVHLYGKQVRPGRKIGHVTVLGDDMEDCRRRARRAARILEEGYQH